jgi:peptidoglycan/LPS O-acetylase OafA/YrhL
VVLVTVIAASTLVRFSLLPQWRYEVCVFGHLQEFFAGYAVADLYVVDWKEKPAESGIWDFVSLVSWVALWSMVARRGVVFLALPFVVLLAYCGALRGTWSRRLFGNPWLVTIGGMCYTIYLVHRPVIGTLTNLGLRFVPAMEFNHAFVVWSIVLTPLTLAISVGLFLLIERPCMNPTWPSLLMAKVRSIGRSSV